MRTSQTLKWLAAWGAAIMASVGGAFLAQGFVMPALPELLIGIAIAIGVGFVLVTVRAHARPGTVYPAVFVLVVVVGLLAAAGAVPLDGPRERGLVLLGASLILLLLARPSRSPGRNLMVMGPSRTIWWGGEPSSVPTIRVLLGYVTVDATESDWSQIRELHVVLVAARLELVVPTSEDVRVRISGVVMSEHGPDSGSELATTISVVGAFGAIEVRHGAAPAQGLPASNDVAGG